MDKKHILETFPTAIIINNNNIDEKLGFWHMNQCILLNKLHILCFHIFYLKEVIQKRFYSSLPLNQTFLFILYKKNPKKSMCIIKIVQKNHYAYAYV